MFKFLFFVLTLWTFDSANTYEFPITGSCGSFRMSRIYNGQTAGLFDHPWYALILINLEDGRKAQCGGTLIDNQHVLTAAHCFNIVEVYRDNGIIATEDLKTVKVILGEHDLNLKYEYDGEGPFPEKFNAISVRAKYVANHADYWADDPSHLYDIAIVKLKSSVVFNDYGNILMRPICMPDTSYLRNKNLVNQWLAVAGFGETETKDGMSMVKKIANMKVLSAAECQAKFNNASSTNEVLINDDSQICAVGATFEDTCIGDSGGPFVYQNTYQMGLVSFGSNDCGKRKIPTVFTRVSFYIDWIVESIETLRTYSSY